MIKTLVFYIFFISLFVLTLNAQHTTDTDELDLVPISTIKKYEAIINPKELKPNYTTDSYNNDSLYLAYNKDRDPSWNGYIGGFGEAFNNEMWFKKSSYKFELDTGTIWLFKASTISGKSLNINLDTLDLPQGAQLSYFEYDYDNQIIYRTHGSQSAYLTNGLPLRSFSSKELYIEYFEPKGLVGEYDFKIIGWGYGFALKEKAITPKIYAGVGLKSGVYFSANIKPLAALITKRVLTR